MKSLVSDSGNSKVDITINIDHTALAYLMGSCLHATKQLTDEQYLQMMTNFNTLMGKDNEELKNLLLNGDLSNSKPFKSENTLNHLKIYYE
ncbi:hypothetical protein FZC66_05275 [Priestia megaterium]|nr:hypothetical protein FZC66_05275 [Priestia megaterium]